MPAAVHRSEDGVHGRSVISLHWAIQVATAGSDPAAEESSTANETPSSVTRLQYSPHSP